MFRKRLFPMWFRSPRPRGNDLLNDLREWCRQESIRPELSAKFDRLRRELELPSLSELAERVRRETDGVSLSVLFERLDQGKAKRSMRRLLRELQDETHWPRLHALAEKLPTDIELPELPELPASLYGQQRQALKGLMLLGMVLHTMPVRPLESSPTTLAGPANITETRGTGSPERFATEAPAHLVPQDRHAAQAAYTSPGQQDGAVFAQAPHAAPEHRIVFLSDDADDAPHSHITRGSRTPRGPPVSLA